MKPTLELAQVIERFGKEFDNQHAPNAYIKRALGALLRCRTAALGGHIDKCDTCGHVRISYNSCRNRHCPKCQNTQSQAWVQDRKADLLPVPYFHLVFTLPAMLNGLFLNNPRRLYNMLFSCAWDTIAQFALTKLHAQAGMVAVLHTCLPAVQDFGRRGARTFPCIRTCTVLFPAGVLISGIIGNK